MASTPNAFTQPLSVVDAMFAQHIAAGNAPAPEFGERDYFQKVIGVDDEEKLARIPCLNDVELTQNVPRFTLVRYRGFVQDVFEPEFYAAVFQETAEPGSGASAAPRLLTSKYRDYIEPAAGCILQQVDGPGGLGQRGACYCVPLPGETPWARAASVERTAIGGGALVTAAGGQSSSSVTANRSNKRGRPDEDVEMAEERPAPGAAEAEKAPKKLAAKFCASFSSDNKMRTAEDFGLNFPLPSEENRGHGASTACIVKLYDADAEALKPCETVEIIGVLCVNPEVAEFSTTSMEDDWRDARQPSTSLVPRLHALVVRHLPFYTPLLPYTNAWLSEARLANAYQSQFSSPGALAAARNAAVSLLAKHLGGDMVAAEFVLMQLVSRSFGRHGDQYLGAWSLNVAGWPAGGNTQSFAQAVAELVPRAVRLEVTADTLNNKRWRPQKDYVANRLIAAQLQLAAGTLLVLDEAGMTVGNLGDAGVKNMMAIQTLVTENLLTCDFMSQDVKLPLEVSSICVSKGRSIVKDVDVLLPLRPAASPVEAPLLGADALNAARWLIALVTRAPRAVKIPDHVAHRFSEDFAAVRQEISVPAELGHTWMGLARARCLTLGEKELSIEQWGAVFQLEKERLQRCKADGLLVQ